jgi:pimeloyl-ACP methyl ester carboxylesterase
VAEPVIAETGAGPVEHVVLGEGPPVVVVHGSPGGYDQGLAMARFLVDAGFQAVIPSRPGYLGTPLAGRESIDAQADLHAALLDVLRIERAGVLCWSGGGPSSFRLAVRHPERVAALVALAPASKLYDSYHPDVPTRLLMNTRPGNWMMRVLGERAPKQLISSTLAAEGDLTKPELKALTEAVFADELKRQFVLDLDATVGLAGDARRAGMDNDLAQFGAIESLELERVAAPTLIVHGDADIDVPPEHGAFAASAIPGAELVSMPRGSHLCFFTDAGADDVQGRAAELLRAASPSR